MSKPRVVIVTGGGSGMGRAIAHRFANAGDKVYILGRRLEKLNDTAKGFPGIECLVTDVTDTLLIEKARDTIIKNHKSVDVLVNNAGGNIKVDPNATLKQANAAWNQIVESNLTSVFNMIFAFDKYLIRPGGRIINISSIAALGGSRQGGVSGQAYSAAKSGIHGLTRTLVSGFAKDKITINSVAPGVIGDTEFFAGKPMPEELVKFYLPKIPLNELGKPDDIAAGVFYLASDDARYITGEIVNINGGLQFGR